MGACCTKENTLAATSFKAYEELPVYRRVDELPVGRRQSTVIFENPFNVRQVDSKTSSETSSSSEGSSSSSKDNSYSSSSDSNGSDEENCTGKKLPGLPNTKKDTKTSSSSSSSPDGSDDENCTNSGSGADLPNTDTRRWSSSSSSDDGKGKSPSSEMSDEELLGTLRRRQNVTEQCLPFKTRYCVAGTLSACAIGCVIFFVCTKSLGCCVGADGSRPTQGGTETSNARGHNARAPTSAAKTEVDLVEGKNVKYAEGFSLDITVSAGEVHVTGPQIGRGFDRFQGLPGVALTSADWSTVRVLTVSNLSFEIKWGNDRGGPGILRVDNSELFIYDFPSAVSDTYVQNGSTIIADHVSGSVTVFEGGMIRAHKISAKTLVMHCDANIHVDDGNLDEMKKTTSVNECKDEERLPQINYRPARDIQFQ